MERKGIFLPPGGGRSYPMGRICSRFLADGAGVVQAGLKTPPARGRGLSRCD
jgi:hypothetical protein